MSTFSLVATTLTGLEETLANELTQLGAQNVAVQNRAVTFSADQALMYRANLWLRTALRVLKPIHSFLARNDRALYKNIQSIDWSDFLTTNDTLAVDCTANSNYFQHSKFVALRVKDAIVDQFRERTGVRPSVDVAAPTIRVNLHIAEAQCTLALDASGDSLHKRGYRLDRTQAPLNEVLGAGLVLLSGWEGASNFIDPMCGSGTIAIEAALLASNRAPGLGRETFGFMRWHDFDAELWQEIKAEAVSKIQTPAIQIVAADRSGKAIRVAEENAERAGVAKLLTFAIRPFEQQEPPEAPGVLLMNPPYGERLKQDDIAAFYQGIGDRLKQAYTGYEAWILSGNQQALKRLGLRPSKKMTLYNGQIACKYQRYAMYEGSVKQKYQQ